MGVEVHTWQDAEMQAYSDMPGVMHQRTKCEVIFAGALSCVTGKVVMNGRD